MDYENPLKVTFGWDNKIIERICYLHEIDFKESYENKIEKSDREFLQF